MIEQDVRDLAGEKQYPVHEGPRLSCPSHMLAMVEPKERVYDEINPLSAHQLQLSYTILYHVLDPYLRDSTFLLLHAIPSHESANRGCSESKIVHPFARIERIILL